MRGLFQCWRRGGFENPPLREVSWAVSLTGAFLRLVLPVTLGLAFLPLPAAPQQMSSQKPCSAYSDPFDSYNTERWHEVLLYSKAWGAVTVENGSLILKTPKLEPCEIQVYSLFSFAGDFDLQAGYDLSDREGLSPCRFNIGLVAQTLGDEKSYKCYLAAAEKEDFFFRGRLDAYGEKNLEKFKGDTAHETGVIRIVRKAGKISFLTLDADLWRVLYTFKEPCHERLRVRFKAQTSGDDDGLQPCPLKVKFDHFIVNSCDWIVEE